MSYMIYVFEEGFVPLTHYTLLRQFPSRERLNKSPYSHSLSVLCPALVSTESAAKKHSPKTVRRRTISPQLEYIRMVSKA